MRLELLVTFSEVCRRGIGKRVGGTGRRREEREEELGRVGGADCRSRRLEGGEKGDGLRISLFDISKVAGASRRTTMLYQGWPGVGFFKHSRGNCGVFREAV